MHHRMMTNAATRISRFGTIKFYCIVLYCIVLYCIVLYCIVLYCIVLYCIVLYCIIHWLKQLRYDLNKRVLYQNIYVWHELI